MPPVDAIDAGSSAAARALAAQRAAEMAAEAERRRQAAIEAARRAREARERAEAAAKAAREERKRAEEAKQAAQRAAERAEHQQDFKRVDALNKQADAAETSALRQEAAAHLADKQAALAESQADDAKQGRAAKEPSEGTRAAQAEVNAAVEVAKVYDVAPGRKDGQRESARKGAADTTQDAMDKALKANKAVVEKERNGEEPSEADIQDSIAKFNDWLDASQHEMRVVALAAEASGGDAKAAVKAQADKAIKGLDDKVFDVDKCKKMVEASRDQVLGESGAVRQVRTEQYTAQAEGDKALADARGRQKGLDAAAEAAEKRAQQAAKSTPTTDHQIDAQQHDLADAMDKRAAADANKHEIEGLKLAFEGSEKDGLYTPGAVSAEYEARIADVEVREANREYQKLVDAGVGGGESMKKAEAALDKAVNARRLAHADADVARTRLDLADAEVENDAAHDRYEAAKAAAPKKASTWFLADGVDSGGTGTDALDLHLPAQGTPTIGTTNTAKGADLSYPGLLKGTGDASPRSPTLARMNEAAGETGQKLDDAKSKLDAAEKAQVAAYDDLFGKDGKPGDLDTTPWTDKADAIRKRLDDAKKDVKDRQDALHQAQGTGKSEATVHEATVALGKALEGREAAEADVKTLEAMTALRDAQRREALGSTKEDLPKLRSAAQDALKHSREVGPGLTPENEARARKDLKEKKAELREKDAAVLAAMRSQDKAETDGEKATADKDLKKAQDQRGELDREVRNLQTALDKIDTNREMLVADTEHEGRGFAKPAKGTSYDDNGVGHEYNLLPKGYDPTATILPGQDGKPRAEGLPPGLKPGDVEVKKEGGTWKVHFKDDAERGYDSDGKAYEVEEGQTLDMDPTTAAVWDAHDRHDKAVKARQDFQEEMADVAPKPAPGSGTAPLGFTGDLDARRNQVSKKISDYTRTNRHDPGPEPDDIRLARKELAAIDAGLEWQQADQVRQGQDAAERGGLKSNSHGEGSPHDIAYDKLQAARKARQEWISEANRLGVQKAESTVKDKQAEHDQWKKAHPYLAGSERDSATWKALQQAKDDAAGLRRERVAGANVQARVDNKAFIAQHLGPDKMDDPAALYELFMQNPEVMAQSLINEHYLAHGSQPRHMDGRTHLANEVGVALGWKTDIDLSAGSASDRDLVMRHDDLFTKLRGDQKKQHKDVVNAIVKAGGEQADVTVLPVVYALPGEDGGLVQTALFKVDTGGGEHTFVDEKGRTYGSVRDFRANNELPVQDVNLAMPEDGEMTLDDKGNVKLFTGDARTESTWEKVRRKGHLDIVAGVAGLVAGTVLAVGSFGTLAAPAALMMAASVTALAASAYGLGTSAQHLVSEAQHGVDINPITNRAARMDWITAGLSAVDLPGAAALTRTTTLAWRAGRAASAAERTTGELSAAFKAKQGRLAERADNTWSPSKGTQRALMAGNVAGTEENLRYMADTWAELSPAERKRQVGMLGLTLGGFMARPMGRIYERGHVAVRTAYRNHRGGPDGDGPGGRGPDGNGPGGQGPVPPDAPRAPAAPDHGAPAVRPVSDEPATVRAAGGGDQAQALGDFREPPPAATSRRPATQPTGKVRPLHPEGAPPVPAERPDAPIAPVVALPVRRGTGPEPDTPLAASPEQSAQVQVLKLAAGGEGQAYPRNEHAETGAPRRSTVKLISDHAARASAGEGPSPRGPHEEAGSNSSRPAEPGSARPRQPAAGRPAAAEPPGGRAALEHGTRALVDAVEARVQQALDAVVAETVRVYATARKQAVEAGERAVDVEADGQIATQQKLLVRQAAEAAGLTEGYLQRQVTAAVGQARTRAREAAQAAREQALEGFDATVRGLEGEGAGERAQTAAGEHHDAARRAIDEAVAREVELARQDVATLGTRTTDAARQRIGKAAAQAADGARAKVQQALDQAYELARREVNVHFMSHEAQARNAVNDAHSKGVEAGEASVTKLARKVVSAGRSGIERAVRSRFERYGAEHTDASRAHADGIRDGFAVQVHERGEQAQRRLADEGRQAHGDAKRALEGELSDLLKGSRRVLAEAARPMPDRSLKATLAGFEAARQQVLERLGQQAEALGRQRAGEVAAKVDQAAVRARADVTLGSRPLRSAAVRQAGKEVPVLATVKALDAGRQVEGPSHPTYTSWISWAANARSIVRLHYAKMAGRAGSQLRPSAAEADIRMRMIERTGDDSLFYVSKDKPGKVMFGNHRMGDGKLGWVNRWAMVHHVGKGLKIGRTARTDKGVRGYRRETGYKTFEEASKAAEARGGAWVYRVEKSSAYRPPEQRRWISAGEIMGALHVNGGGEVLPVAIPNVRSPAWAAQLPGSRTDLVQLLEGSQWPAGLKPPSGHVREADGSLRKMTDDEVAAAASLKQSARESIKTVAKSLGLTIGVSAGAAWSLRHFGLDATSFWAKVGVYAFDYRAVAGTTKAGLKSGIANRVRALQDPNLDANLRTAFLNDLDRMMSSPHKGGALRGIPSEDRARVPELVRLAREGTPAQRALAVEELAGYGGKVFSFQTRTGRVLDGFRMTSFLGTGIRNALDVGTWFAGRAIHDTVGRQILGNVGSGAGIGGSATRWIGKDRTPSDWTKRMPPLSSYGDGFSVGPMMWNDVLPVVAAVAGLYSAVRGGQAIAHHDLVKLAIHGAALGGEVVLAKSLFNDAGDDWRLLGKNPSPGVARAVPPLIWLAPGALLYTGAVLLLPDLFGDDEPKKAPDGGETSTPTSTPSSTPSATPSSTPSDGASPAPSTSPSATDEPAPPNKPSQPARSQGTPTPGATPTPRPRGGRPVLFASEPRTPALVALQLESAAPVARRGMDPALGQLFNLSYNPRERA